MSFSYYPPDLGEGIFAKKTTIMKTFKTIFSAANTFGHNLRWGTPVIFSAFLFCLVFSGCQKLKTRIYEEHQGLSQLISPHPEAAALAVVAGNKQVFFPGSDPGIPGYCRMGSILNQFFVSDGWLVIPFFRDPGCVPPGFNLLNMFDVPAAFSCQLFTEGSYIIEMDAPRGTFPIIVQSTGTAVPFWFVRWTDFQRLSADGIVTITEIQGLHPIKGIAGKFRETLKPRIENHFVQINASGTLEDGRTFSFHVTHAGDQSQATRLSFN